MDGGTCVQLTALFRKYDTEGTGLVQAPSLLSTLGSLGVPGAKQLVDTFQKEALVGGRGTENGIDFRAFFDWLPSDQTISRTKKDSLVLGVSVAFLAQDFLTEVRGHFSHDDVDYYAMLEPLFTGPASRGATRLCPRDGYLGCSYVDALDNVNTARSNLMLSWCWRYSARAVVGSLVRWCRSMDKDPEKTFVWQCALCNNQIRLQEKASHGEVMPFEEFRDLFSTRLLTSGHLLAIVTPWNKPLCLERVWCIFEMWSAMTNPDVRFDVIMPESEESRFQDQLDCHAMVAVDQLFTYASIQGAEATVMHDRDCILRLVDDSPWSLEYGYEDSQPCEEVNSLVATRLQRWLAQSAIKHAEDLLVTRQPSAPRVWCHVAQMLMEGVSVSGFDASGTLTGVDACSDSVWATESSDVFASAMDVHRLAGTLESKECALLARRLGFYYYRSGNNQKAMDFFAQAQTAFEASGCINTKYASMMSYMGAWYCEQGSTLQAWAYLSKAKDVFQTEGATETLDYAKVLVKMGKCQALNGKGVEARNFYIIAAQVYEIAGAVATQSSTYIKVLVEIAGLFEQHGQHRSALEYYQKAKEVHLSVGGIDARNYAILVSRMAACYRCLGEPSKVAQLYKETRNVLKVPAGGSASRSSSKGRSSDRGSATSSGSPRGA